MVEHHKVSGRRNELEFAGRNMDGVKGKVGSRPVVLDLNLKLALVTGLLTNG